MKRIEQTTLSNEDIIDHHKLLEQQHCVDLFLPADRRQEVADEMLKRFCSTFIE